MRVVGMGYGIAPDVYGCHFLFDIGFVTLLNVDSFNLAPRPDFRGWPRLRSRFFGCQKEFFTLARRK